MILATALAPLSFFAAATMAFAQDPKNALSQEERAGLERRLEQLDGRSTDWVLLADISDKVQPLGARAVPILREHVKAALERDDPRYGLRLLGVLCRLDDDGARQLFDIVGSEDEGAASIAARVIGRSQAPASRIHGRLAELLEQEQRPSVTSALALAAADAGATAASKVLRARLSDASVEPGIARWLAIALASLEKDLPKKTLMEWLTPESLLLESAILLARSYRDPEVESRLFALLESAEDETRWTWIIEALGACGGDESRKALRESLKAEEAEAEDESGGVLLASSDIDPRLLALLRLGEAAAITWAKANVASEGRGAAPSGVTFQMMSEEQAQVPELLGKWRITDADSAMEACSKSKTASVQIRVHAARGLCWRRDVRGLRAAAELLCAPESTAMPFDLHAGGIPAQKALHDFVASLDRPDYVPLGEDASKTAPEIGKRWLAWLEKNGSKIQWREPLPEGQDLLLWR